MYTRLEVLIIDGDPFALAQTRKTVSETTPRHQIRIFSSPTAALDYMATPVDSKNHRTDRPAVILWDNQYDAESAFLDAFVKFSLSSPVKYTLFELSQPSNAKRRASPSKTTPVAGEFIKPLTTDSWKQILVLAGIRP